uniref:Uncharacterized protein n=1 Tax=Ciona intestinalis TaxID=7719 RepID=H2XPS5_CIOIN
MQVLQCKIKVNRTLKKFHQQACLEHKGLKCNIVGWGKMKFVESNLR